MDLTLRPLARTASMPLSDKLLLSAFFLLSTALGAHVVIPLPFTPVPVTLQSFFVILAGYFLGSRWGASVQGAYLLLGAVGAPLLAPGISGGALLFGPTTGYLLAFAPAAYLVGRLAPRCRTFSERAVLFGAASAFILVCGASWLGATLGLSPSRALVLGALPFLAGDALKAVVAAALAGRVAR